MNLYGGILKSIKNERSEVLWDGAMKNMYYTFQGQVEEKICKEYGKGDIRVVGWKQGEKAQKPMESFRKEGILSNNLTMPIE